MARSTSWVDVAKGIGIILVVLGHVLRGLFAAGLIDKSGFFLVIENTIYSFHMPLFFFLSGLFFVKSYGSRGFKGFVLNKLDIIIYPYVVWSLFQGAIEVYMSNYTNGAPVTWAEVSNLLIPRAQFWYLPVLFLFLILSVFLVRLMVAVFILSIAAYMFFANESLPLYVAYFSRFYVFFVTGILWSKYIGVESRIEWVTGGFIVAFFILAQLFFNYGSYYYDQYDVVTFFISMLGVLFMVVMSQCLVNIGWYKSISYLGSASMVIYLTHILPGAGIRVFLHKFFGVDDVFVHLLLGLSAGIFPPLILYYMLSKYPVLDSFFRFDVVRKKLRF